MMMVRRIKAVRHHRTNRGAADCRTIEEVKRSDRLQRLVLAEDRLEDVFFPPKVS